MEEVPFEDRVVPRVEIDWERSCWWWHPLTRAIHPAIRWTSLLTGLLGIYLLQHGLGWAQALFSPAYETRLHFEWTGPAWLSLPRWELQGAFPEMTLNNLAYFSFAALWIALVSGTLGGVLARRAAIELGQRNMASWLEAIRISVGRLQSSLWAAGMNLVALLALLLPILALGGLARLGVPAAAVAGALLLTLCIPLIFASGRTLLSLVICFPLSVCAIQVEKKADAFEGFSRSNAYLFQRPVVSLLFVFGLFILGQVGAFLVYWTIQFGWGIVRSVFLVAAGNYAEAVAWADTGSQLSTALISAYHFSYFWSATAALYLILRRSVDDTELDDLDMLDSELEKQPPRIPETSQPAAQEPQAQSGQSDS